MSKDALWLAMLAAQFDAACSAMDAQRVPTRDRMVWPPDMQLPLACRIVDLDDDMHTLAIHPCELFDYPGQLRPLDAAIRGIFNRQMKGTQ